MLTGTVFNKSLPRTLSSLRPTRSPFLYDVSYVPPHLYSTAYPPVFCPKSVLTWLDNNYISLAVELCRKNLYTCMEKMCKQTV